MKKEEIKFICPRCHHKTAYYYPRSGIAGCLLCGRLQYIEYYNLIKRYSDYHNKRKEI